MDLFHGGKQGTITQHRLAELQMAVTLHSFFFRVPLCFDPQLSHLPCLFYPSYTNKEANVTLNITWECILWYVILVWLVFGFQLSHFHLDHFPL